MQIKCLNHPVIHTQPLDNKALDDRNVREDLLGFPPLVSAAMFFI